MRGPQTLLLALAGVGCAPVASTKDAGDLADTDTPYATTDDTDCGTEAQCRGWSDTDTDTDSDTDSDTDADTDTDWHSGTEIHTGYTWHSGVWHTATSGAR